MVHARRRRSGRRRKKSRIGRAHTTSLRTKFECEGGTGFFWVAGNATNAAGTNFNAPNGNFNAYSNVSGNFNAIVYRFDFPLLFLYSNDPGFALFSAGWDLFRVNRQGIKVTCSIKPNTQVTQGFNASSYNFTQCPTYDSDVTWVNYDGVLAVNAGGAYNLQSNGDCTDEIAARTGYKRHRAFSSFRASMVPKVVVPVCKEIGAPYGDDTGSNVRVVMNQRPWLTQQNSQPYTGSIFLAVSYKGQPSGNSGNANYQPQYVLLVHTWFDITLKSPLFG